jgi:hypothetical protein
MDEKRRCKATNKDGQPCRAEARTGGDHCIFHDPHLDRQRAEGRKRGGKARSKTATVKMLEAADRPLSSVGDVVTLLGETINGARRGQVDSKLANAVGYLSSVLLRALQDTDLAEALAALRRDLEDLKHGDGGGPAGNGTAAAGNPSLQESQSFDAHSPPPGPRGIPEPGGDDSGPVAGFLATLPFHEDADALFPAGRQKFDGGGPGAADGLA